MTAMTIELRFFAGVREALGIGHESLVLPAGVTTAGELRRHLQARGGVWQSALADQRPLRMACNHVVIDASFSLSQGCELAFFPPVTGG